VKNKLELTQENLAKYTTYRGILLIGMFNDMKEGKAHITKCNDDTFKKFVPSKDRKFFSIYRAEW